MNFKQKNSAPLNWSARIPRPREDSLLLVGWFLPGPLATESPTAHLSVFFLFMKGSPALKLHTYRLQHGNAKMWLPKASTIAIILINYKTKKNHFHFAHHHAPLQGDDAFPRCVLICSSCSWPAICCVSSSVANTIWFNTPTSTHKPSGGAPLLA